ncbi:glyoxalase I [Cystobasidium minutum MCA 4210]|uniref:glyoxalase I n=1 Tax=Cystobasidium minutum MCA 4210 TaxID=1397322 RepID=UPI0034CDBEF8|eukprot:jgi/Rhomi1/163546/estExt_Genewise1Plus.C_80144
MVRPEGTESFKFNHTMLRVKDPKASLKFYQEVVGMELIDQHEASDFTLYFLAFPLPEYEHLSKNDKAKARFAREGILELTHNHGTENDPNFSYVNGNQDPHKGFGHIAISVQDVEAACERFDKMGVKWQKKLTDGKMKHIAFMLDPDNYWIEIVPARSSGP